MLHLRSGNSERTIEPSFNIFFMDYLFRKKTGFLHNVKGHRRQRLQRKSSFSYFFKK